MTTFVKAGPYRSMVGAMDWYGSVGPRTVAKWCGIDEGEARDLLDVRVGRIPVHVAAAVLCKVEPRLAKRMTVREGAGGR